MPEQKPSDKPQAPPPPKPPDESLKGYIERGSKPARSAEGNGAKRSATR